MHLLLVPLLLLFIALMVVVLLPWSILQRYRAGTARRRARGWVALINLWGIGLSAAILLVTGAISSGWIPGVFTYTLAGLIGGFEIQMRSTTLLTAG